jgi:hypothetical protein
MGVTNARAAGMDVEFTTADKAAGQHGQQLFVTFQERIKATKDAAAAQAQQASNANKTQPAAQGKGKGQAKQDQTMTGDTDGPADTSQHGNGQAGQEKRGPTVTAEEDGEEETETAAQELSRSRHGKRPNPPVDEDSEVEITGETRHVSEPVTNNVRISYSVLSF